MLVATIELNNAARTDHHRILKKSFFDIGYITPSSARRRQISERDDFSIPGRQQLPIQAPKSPLDPAGVFLCSTALQCFRHNDGHQLRTVRPPGPGGFLLLIHHQLHPLLSNSLDILFKKKRTYRSIKCFCKFGKRFCRCTKAIAIFEHGNRLTADPAFGRKVFLRHLFCLSEFLDFIAHLYSPPNRLKFLTP